MKHWLAFAALVVVSGCPSAGRDSDETQGNLPPIDGPTVEFDPANSIIPFPNNLVINPATGKVNIPAPACETPAAKAVREGVLNKLDGFGTYEAAMQVTFTEDVDPASLDGNIVMFERKKMGTDISPSSAQMVPIVVLPSTALRFNAADCTAAPAQIHAATIVPMVPLDQKSTYTVALLAGIKTAGGQDYIPSSTWALVRQSIDPVTLKDGCDYSNPTSCTVVSEKTPLTPGGDANGNGVADIIEIVGLDQLWKAHATGLAFLSSIDSTKFDRSNILVAWEVTTQTVTDQLDPSVAGSPASTIATMPFVPNTTHSVVQGGNTANFLIAVYQQLLGLSQAQAQALCNNIGCNNVGDVLGAGLGVMTYQTHVANAWSGMNDVPGPWDDPIMPTIQDPFTVPAVNVPGVLPVLAFVPAGTPPANGWPVVVFGHGLGSQKESLFVFAPQLASAGFASVAIDFVDHGDRAVRVTAAPTLGCSGHCTVTTSTTCQHDTDCPQNESCTLPGFGAAKQCFAPFLSTDLAGTRDNIRQTVLDLQRLTHAVAACSTTSCGAFKVDPAHILYTGISLGGIIGSTTTAVDPDLVASVLNVPGVGLLDILENSETLEIKCPLVNGLIDAGIIQGMKWDPANPTVGTCLTDDWKMQPGYQQFAGIARIVLDPADGANFTKMLATRRFLIQEVIGDKVVPNIATEREGMLVGLTAATAEAYAPTNPGVPSGASAAILNMPMANKWLQYPTLPSSDAGTLGFGNAFQHGSLLSPVSPLVAPGHCSNDPATACVQDATCGGGGACVYPGTLGTARLQTDAITYLLSNQ